MTKKYDLLSQMDPLDAEFWIYTNVASRRPQDVAERLFYAESALESALKERAYPFSDLAVSVNWRDMPLERTVKTVMVRPEPAWLRIDATELENDAEKKLRAYGALLAEYITRQIREQVAEYLPERDPFA